MTFRSTSSRRLLMLGVAGLLLAGSAQAQQGQQGQSNQPWQGAQQQAQQQAQQGQRGQQWQQGGRMQQQAQRRIPSQYREERGRIVEVRPVRVRGQQTPNYLVVVETQPGRRVVTDIGQAIQGANVQPGGPISVRGRIVRVGDQGALLMADAFRVGNQAFRANRPMYTRNMQGQAQPIQQSQFREESGRAVEIRPVRVRGVGTPNYLVVIETQPGRRVVADIGQAQQGMNIQQNTPLTVRGKIVRVGDQGALLMADAVQVGNRTFELDRPALLFAQR